MNREVDDRQRVAFIFGLAIGAMFVSAAITVTMIGVALSDARSRSSVPPSSRVARRVQIRSADALETPSLSRAPPAHRARAAQPPSIEASSLLRAGL